MKNKIELEHELAKINKLIDRKIIRGESYQKEAAQHRRIIRLLTV